MLLFYSNQERHKNEGYVDGSRHFSMELKESWLKRLAIDTSAFEGKANVRNRRVKRSLLRIIPELRNKNNETHLMIEMSIADALGEFSNFSFNYSTAPDWLRQIRELLHDSPYKKLSLTELAEFAGVHPVTLSKLFPRFFGMTIGDYIREIKLEKSFALLTRRHVSLQAIALQCGFSDHAHYSRVFKLHKGITPSQYRQFVYG